jgi:type IV pilus assembly protein PilA
MLQKLMERRNKGNEEGFTLIELMVVVLIIAILIAIAIPTFLGARQRANNRAAQSSLRNALTAAKTIFTDNNDYSTAGVGNSTTGMTSVEPSLTFVAANADSTGPKVVSVSPNSPTQWVAAVKSASGNCYWIKYDSNGPGTSFATDTTSGDPCQAGDVSKAGTFSGAGFP